jgi:hypothetical protein
MKSHSSGMKFRIFTTKKPHNKTVNSKNFVKCEVNWPWGSQFTARHMKNRLQFDK